MTGALILAGASVRSLAESAMACGLRPWCVDMFADADLNLLLQENGHPEPIRAAWSTRAETMRIAGSGLLPW